CAVWDDSLSGYIL
nr:immunoglobulin light chain junction region [Macaca mulatta]MPO05137.1 immunoglobulin light chain junction region [Macaca mulatta]MPO08922.1 immunoglobulin light chain junction region [Macaca mulatta]MPO09340.1 immunoglobulin light chain junction region [Macaca mulatta]MPO09750.1 immunoglobulin light chain junction region [Macaca mulatta]